MKDGTRPARCCRLSVPRDDGAESDDDMSTPKIDLSPVDGTPTPAPDGGGPATRAQLQAMRDLSIPFDLEHPPTFDDAARLIREAEEAENPMRVVMGPPVRDIREAMHPAESAGAVLDDFAHRLIDIGESGRAAVQGVVNEIAAKVAPGHEPPRMVWTTPDLAPLLFENAAPEGPTVHFVTPHVATLPDGTRVNLPAGTVLREGEIERGQLPPTNLNDALLRLAHGGPDTDKEALMHFIRCWHQPSREIIARDLLRRAHARLAGEPAAKNLDASIVAFLAGAAPPEHPLFALVRSFVGKPGDKPGPVWTALMCVQARLSDDDLDGAKAAATALEEALNERIGQMHDALGRDTTEERTR